MWNEEDEFLKERLFGLTGHQVRSELYVPVIDCLSCTIVKFFSFVKIPVSFVSSKYLAK